jgi:hypothetical protein
MARRSTRAARITERRRYGAGLADVVHAERFAGVMNVPSGRPASPARTMITG